MQTECRKIAIVGAGSVGTALSLAFSGLGHAVSLGTRRGEITETRLAKLHKGTRSDLQVVAPQEAVHRADIVLLTVSDDAIQSVCSGLMDNLHAGCIVAHCSGALDSTLLEPARQAGHPVCSAHPLNTFPNPQAAAEVLRNSEHRTSLFCEGDQAALARINQLFSEAGFQPVEISREAKPLYHASCVIACNYLTVLMDISLQTGEAAGLQREQLWPALQPLIQATLSNITERGTAESLSGPVARGDVDTVRKQLEQMADLPTEIGDLYRQLGNSAVTLANKSNSLEPQTAGQLKELFKK